MKKYLFVDAHRGDIAVQMADADEVSLVAYIKRKLHAWYINKGVQGDPEELCQKLPDNPVSDFFVSDRNTSIRYLKSDDMFVVRFDRINIASDDPDITLEIVPMEFVPNIEIDK
ncbi:hypothetical protein [Xylocopilactobacillus apicola]|uniref:Uncharacterized protein n=1 Tax=Xylocopilactobacillus apicola TaxID=2932184 RepID=A0AAU9CXR6_9LACO|nr:hypothetical protein [Xylocopilactobacillus apicola]BDR58792.1 hypothetical protein XA3_12330 [Xylocopilactobacillus apicola]